MHTFCPNQPDLPKQLKTHTAFSMFPILTRWHVGWCNSSYLPQNRGFDSFRGVWHSATDHYNYIYEGDMGGYDLHYNDDIDTNNTGTYSSVSTF